MVTIKLLAPLSGSRRQPAHVGLAWALPLTVLVSGLSLVSPTAAQAGLPATAPEPCLTVADDESDAAAMAVRCQTRVQIADSTTETDEAFALPDGTVEFEHRYRPVRVERDGDWVPVDTTLQIQADGSVAPKAAAADVAFSGGGTDPMVSVENNDGAVALSSPWGALPTPTLAGNTATYREVRPGIDLRLTADVDGFSQVFVVKTRQAAKDPALNKLNFEMETDGLVVAANKTGSLKVADEETGRLALTASTPVMWDSDTTAGTTAVAAASAETASDGDKARMPVTVGDDTISITPDQKMLDAPGTKFPVYVDPSFTTYRTGFVMVTASNPTSTYFNTADDALVGSNNGVNKWRTFFNFSTATAPFVGKQVTSADLRLQEKWSGSCTPTPFDAYATYAAGSTTTWNNQPTWSTKQDTQTVAKGYSTSGMGGASACPAGEVRMDITPITQQAAERGGNITIGLRSPDETKLTYWKRFENNPKISVIYNNPPQLVSQQTDSTGKCVTGTSRPNLATTTPTLRASYSDADSDPTTTTFEWWALSGSAAIGSGVRNSVSAGTSAAVAVPAGQLANGSAYKWRVKASDGFATSAWSSWCEFSVVFQAPTLAARATDASSQCVVGTSRPATDTTSPLLQARYSSQSDTSADVDFEFQKLDGTVVGQETDSADTLTESAAVAVPQDLLLSGEAYRWRARATGRPSGLTSNWSGFCEFVVRANFRGPLMPDVNDDSPMPEETPGAALTTSAKPATDIVVNSNGNSIPTAEQSEAIGDADDVADEASIEDLYDASALSEPAQPMAADEASAEAVDCYNGAPVNGSNGEALCDAPMTAEEIAQSDAEDEAIADTMPDTAGGEVQAFGATSTKQPPKICLGKAHVLRLTRFESCYKETRKIRTWKGAVQVGWFMVAIYRYTQTKSNSRTWKFNLYVKNYAAEGDRLKAVAKTVWSSCTNHCEAFSKGMGGRIYKKGSFVHLDTGVQVASISQGKYYNMRASARLFMFSPTNVNLRWFNRVYNSTGVRCDKALKSTRLLAGCVIPSYVPTFVVKESGTGALPELAQHIHAAQDNGLMGRPTCYPYKVQNGPCSTENALQRETDDAKRDANRNMACPASLAKIRPAGKTCDEYPMASTVQGAANVSIPWWGQRVYAGCQMGPPSGGSGPDGWSACFIDKDDNSLGGSLLGAFYESGNRILNQEAFFVAVE